MYGHGEPTHAESTWTHALINFRSTLLRAAVDRVGIDSFGEKVGDDDGGVGGDVAGAENSPHAVQRVRVSKTLQYYGDPSNFEELAVLAITLGPFDEKLLFPFMGDASKHAQQAHVSGVPLIRKLVCPGISKVVEFDSASLELLKRWRGGLDRRPWMVLDVLMADLT